MLSRRIFAVILTVFLVSIPVLAGQNATVTQKSTNIQQFPTKDSPVIDVLKLGDNVRISTFHKDGWYKIKAPSGSYGWVWQGDLSVETNSADVRAANLNLLGQHREKFERPYPVFFVRPGITNFTYWTIDVGGSHSKYWLAPFGFLDVQYAIEPRLRIQTRLGYYRTATVTQDFFTVNRSGFPVLLGFDLELDRSRNWRTGLNLLGGLDFTSLTIKAKETADPNSIGNRAKAVLTMFSVLFKNVLAKDALLVYEIGAFYSPAKRFNLGEAGFMTSAGSPSSATSKMLGVYVGIGIELER